MRWGRLPALCLSLGILACGGGGGGGGGSSTPSGPAQSAPTITSFAPTSGPALAQVTLTGTGFTGATAVEFNGLAASFTVVSSTSITATVPAGATSGKVSVTTSAGAGTSQSVFTVTTSAAPSITSVAPESGPVGASVTLTGTNFIVPAASSGGARVQPMGVTIPPQNPLNFNGVPAQIISITSTSISTTVPAGATTGLISFETTEGLCYSPTAFTVTAPPLAVPTASFGFSPGAPTTGQTVTFTDTSSNSPTQWSWEFGDGAASAVQNPTHAYSSAGTFTVTLTATNATGPSAPDAQTVTVVPAISTTIFYPDPSLQNTVIVNSGNAAIAKTPYSDSLVVGNQWNISVDFTSVTEVRYASLLWFDLSSLSGKTITTALLQLSIAQGEPQLSESFNCAACISSWGDTVTWNTIPNYQTSYVDSRTPPTGGSPPPLVFQVPNIVQEWVSGRWSNYGFMIWDPNGEPDLFGIYNYTYVFDVAAASAPLRPQLIVQWQ